MSEHGLTSWRQFFGMSSGLIRAGWAAVSTVRIRTCIYVESAPICAWARYTRAIFRVSVVYFLTSAGISVASMRATSVRTALGVDTLSMTFSDSVDSALSVGSFEVICFVAGSLGESLGIGEGSDSVSFSISFLTR